MSSWLPRVPVYSGPGKGQQLITTSLLKVDETAAFSSFVHHWQQTKETLENTSKKREINNDDVTAIINHFGKLINILLVDLRQMSENAIHLSIDSEESINNEINRRFRTEWHPEDDGLHTPIFDHFMAEQILQTIVDWSLNTCEFVNMLKLELLKAYESLLSQSLPEILVYKPITDPLLKLLQSCSGCVPVDVEKRLVVLLNQLCVSLMNNSQLLDYFFHASEDQGPTKFFIFSLLLPFIHREGVIGQQARDALLLCMALSASHSSIGEYIAKYSNFCPVLAAGLSGLYSMLPRTLRIETDGWYRISPMDVAAVSELQMFINSLEFCNAVVQVSHPLVKKQLIEFLYPGFLVPVLGPALCQGVSDELVATIAYIDLFLRTITEPELQKPFLALLLTQQDFSDLPLVSHMISHLHSSNLGLSLVMLNLFNTLVSLHSEDTMLILILQYLTPCTHVMLSQKSKLSHPPYNAAERFIRLMPTVVQYERISKGNEDKHNSSDNSQSHQRNLSTSSATSFDTDSGHLENISSFNDYLQEAKKQIALSSKAFSSWTWHYDGSHPSASMAVRLINIAKVSPAVPFLKPRVHSDFAPRSLPYNNAQLDSLEKPRSSSLPEYINTDQESSITTCDKVPLRFNLLGNQNDGTMCSFKRVIDKSHYQKFHKDIRNHPTCNILDEVTLLDSIDGSSGYDSFNIKTSRDSSPFFSTKGTPSNSSNIKANSSQHGLNSEISTSSDNFEEIDEEFLKYLESFDASSNETSLCETFNEIEDAFSLLSLSPSSSNDISPIFSNPSEDDFFYGTPWLDFSNSSTDEDEKDIQEEVQSPYPKPTIGPFLEILISQIEEMLSKNLHCTLLAINCLTTLACYPLPLMTSLLLQPSVILQPAVRSLFQVLGKLKQKIDVILTLDDLPLLIDARHWLYDQFFSVNPLYGSSSTPQPSSPSNPFSRKGSKRWKFFDMLGALKNSATQPDKEKSMENIQDLPDGTGYRYSKGGFSQTPQPRLLFIVPAHKRHAALCAVVLREWILELCAISQEHTVRCLSQKFYSFTSGS